jgi:hypothetical protein
MTDPSATSGVLCQPSRQKTPDVGLSEQIEVRGDATPDEIAAVLAAVDAALRERGRPPAESGYERWRRERLRALGRSSR